MEVYDKNGNLLESFDTSRGWLEPSYRTVHHEAVEAVAEVSHLETVCEYPNGGKDVRRIIDVPGVEALEAWDEDVGILIYHPYTDEELAEQEAEHNKPTVEQRLAELEQALAETRTQRDTVAAIAFVALAEAGGIDVAIAAEHQSVFGEWQPGMTYAAGQLRCYKDKLYRCVQAHTSQEDWEPDKTPALWIAAANPIEEWPEWTQPQGAHDACMKGDKRSWVGKHWISEIDNNVWEPGVYGWIEASDDV